MTTTITLTEKQRKILHDLVDMEHYTVVSQLEVVWDNPDMRFYFKAQRNELEKLRDMLKEGPNAEDCDTE